METNEIIKLIIAIIGVLGIGHILRDVLWKACVNIKKFIRFKVVPIITGKRGKANQLVAIAFLLMVPIGTVSYMVFSSLLVEKLSAPQSVFVTIVSIPLTATAGEKVVVLCHAKNGDGNPIFEIPLNLEIIGTDNLAIDTLRGETNSDGKDTLSIPRKHIEKVGTYRIRPIELQSGMQIGPEDTFYVSVAEPKKLEIVSGNNQNGVVGKRLQEPLKVQLMDQFGNVVPGRRVQFKTLNEDGQFFDSKDVTDLSGKAYTWFRAGQNPGRIKISVNCGNLRETFIMTIFAYKYLVLLVHTPKKISINIDDRSDRRIELYRTVYFRGDSLAFYRLTTFEDNVKLTIFSNENPILRNYEQNLYKTEVEARKNYLDIR